jgi:hypothetical protein
MLMHNAGDLWLRSLSRRLTCKRNQFVQLAKIFICFQVLAMAGMLAEYDQTTCSLAGSRRQTRSAAQL